MWQNLNLHRSECARKFMKKSVVAAISGSSVDAFGFCVARDILQQALLLNLPQQNDVGDFIFFKVCECLTDGAQRNFTLFKRSVCSKLCVQLCLSDVVKSRSELQTSELKSR